MNKLIKSYFTRIMKNVEQIKILYLKTPFGHVVMYFNHFLSPEPELRSVFATLTLIFFNEYIY